MITKIVLNKKNAKDDYGIIVSDLDKIIENKKEDKNSVDNGKS